MFTQVSGQFPNSACRRVAFVGGREHREVGAALTNALTTGSRDRAPEEVTVLLD